MPDPITVSNSSCLISLETIGRLDLLRDLYGTITVPSAVASECGTAFPAWINIQNVANQALVQSLRFHLGAGESEAIALTDELSAARLILDDKKARHAARSLNLPITGTVAVLIQAKLRGRVQVLRDVLNELTASGFFLSAALADAACRQVGE